MSSQCKSDSRNLQYTCLAKHTCVPATIRLKLCYPQNPRQQRKRMEYSTVSPNWKGRSRLWKEKTVTDAAENCNTASAFPVSCQLHGPYYDWTRRVDGKTKTVRLTGDQARVIEEWISNMRRVEKIVMEMENISVQAAAVKIRK